MEWKGSDSVAFLVLYKMSTQTKTQLFSLLFIRFDSGSTSTYPFLSAGSTKAAKEPIDHLNGAENHLQTACGQQGRKQSNVELHNVLRFQTYEPPCVVSQVIVSTVGGEKKEAWWTMRTLESSMNIVQRGTCLFLKGVVQVYVLQRGPFFKPTAATARLYRAPTRPTAANAIDKNICRS